ncbi:protein RADIALIS-like 6-like [Hibiscus syriacus]|uniref:Protein RADIALIS-like 6-like n=2 Tax=Hibiscus syriacus TaxID=106335 RepID=A0A6A3A284_HIBSY|nr:protein RADIALIS-like 6-like [Hibiscus syriacus]
MGMLSSFSYNNKLNTEPRTLDHHTEPNPQHQIENPGQHPEPVSAPVPLPPTEDGPLIRYGECLKNHAARMGGYVVDGCGEFMPSGEDDAGEALKCAACECHRNFHRKEMDGGSQCPTTTCCAFPYYKNNTRRPTPLRQQRCPPGLSNSTTHCLPVAPPVTMNFGGGNSGGRAEPSSKDLNVFAGGRDSWHLQSSKKRFRTKFSEDQKEKMREFGKNLGWRIKKQDEAQVQQFCGEVGVKRQVFKVWMHNSKQAMKRKQL